VVTYSCWNREGSSIQHVGAHQKPPDLLLLVVFEFRVDFLVTEVGHRDAAALAVFGYLDAPVAHRFVAFHVREQQGAIALDL